MGKDSPRMITRPSWKLAEGMGFVVCLKLPGKYGVQCLGVVTEARSDGVYICPLFGKTLSSRVAIGVGLMKVKTERQ